MNQSIRHITNVDWITLVIIGCLVSIATIKYVYPKKFEDFLFIISSDKFLNNTIKNNTLLHPFNSILLLVDWVATALFLYIGYCFYTEIAVGSTVAVYLYILGTLILYETVKIVVERLVGYIMNIRELIKTYTYRKVAFRNFMSLLILLFCIILSYNNVYLKNYYSIFLGIFIGMYLISLLFTLRKFQSEILQRPSYFILYFCTLEIAPYYIMYKVFI